MEATKIRQSPASSMTRLRIREVKKRLQRSNASSAKDVGQIVADCTDSWTDPKPPWRARKEQYLAALPKKPRRSLLVSLADKTHNARAIEVDLRRLGDELWSRFSGGKTGTIWYYSSLAQIFAKALPSGLTSEFENVVAGFGKGSPLTRGYGQKFL